MEVIRVKICHNSKVLTIKLKGFFNLFILRKWDCDTTSVEFWFNLTPREKEKENKERVAAFKQT